MHVIEAIDQLRGKALAPIYVMFGESDYWTDQWVNAVTERAREVYGDVERVDLGRQEAVSGNQVLTAWNTPNLWGKAQVFCLDQVSRASGVAEALRAIAGHRADGRHLLLRERKPQPGSRREFSAPVIEVGPPAAARWRKWTAAMAGARGVKLSTDGLGALVRLIPQDGYHLEHELEKMRLADQKGLWTHEEVLAAVLPEMGEQAVWAVTDALMTKDPARLAGNLSRALDQGKTPVMLLALLGRQLAQLRRARDAASPAAFQAAEKLPDFVCRKIIQAAHHWSPEELATAIFWTADLDRWFKQSLGDPRVALTEYVVLILSRGSHERRTGS